MRINELKRHSRFISALFIAKFKRRKVPLIAVICVTNRCNLDCWYCYGEHHYRSKCREFTTEELLGAVRSLSSLGTQIIQLQGGEPLLRDDLPLVINEAKKLGMTVDMVTNGTLIRKTMKTVRLLDRICISLDGPPELNDRNRGQGVHGEAVAGIKSARSLNLPVRLSTVLTGETTVEDIDWLVGFAIRNKVKLNFSPFFEFVSRFRPGGGLPHVIPDEKLRLLLHHIKKHKLNNAPIQFSSTSYATAYKWPFSYKKRMAGINELPRRFIRPRCYHGDFVIFIDSEGSIYPCCNFWGKTGKNIFRHGLEESIAGLRREGCEACYIPAYIDRNFFFDIHPGVWLNYIIQSIKELL